VAEAAVAVIDEYQARGLLTLLLEALGAVALENGITRFRGYAWRRIVPSRDVLEALGASITHDSPGMVRVEVDLRARSADTGDTSLWEVLGIVAVMTGQRSSGPTGLRLTPPARMRLGMSMDGGPGTP
jgi:hypothetical protein